MAKLAVEPCFSASCAVHRVASNLTDRSAATDKIFDHMLEQFESTTDSQRKPITSQITESTPAAPHAAIAPLPHLALRDEQQLISSHNRPNSRRRSRR